MYRTDVPALTAERSDRLSRAEIDFLDRRAPIAQKDPCFRQHPGTWIDLCGYEGRSDRLTAGHIEQALLVADTVLEPRMDNKSFCRSHHRRGLERAYRNIAQPVRFACQRIHQRETTRGTRSPQEKPLLQ